MSINLIHPSPFPSRLAAIAFLDEKLPPIDEAAFNEEAGVGMYATHTIKDVDPAGALT